METKEFLCQVKKIDFQIRNKLIERQQWYDLALCITSNMGGEKVQASGPQSKMADAVGRCVDMEVEIDSLVARLVAKKTEVVQTIEGLDSATEYDVLHLRYIQHRSLQEIADHYGKDYGWVTTVHGRALKNVERLREEKK